MYIITCRRSAARYLADVCRATLSPWRTAGGYALEIDLGLEPGTPVPDWFDTRLRRLCGELGVIIVARL